MPADLTEIRRLAGLTEEKAMPEPDYDALADSVSDIIEAARQLGKAAEHGNAEHARGMYFALVKHIALAGSAIPGAPAAVGKMIQNHSASLMRTEAIEGPREGSRLRKR